MLNKVLSSVIGRVTLFSLFVVMLVMSLVGGGMEFAAAGNGTYYINDDFESDTPGEIPEGWILKYPGEGTSFQKVVNDVSKSGSNSFKLDGKSLNAAVFYKNITDIPDNITIEASVQPSSTGESGNLSLYHASSNRSLGRVVFRDEQIYYSTQGHDEKGLVNLQSYTLNTWYDVKIAYDLTARTFDVYIDGVLKASDAAMYSTEEPDSIELSSGNGAGDNIIYFDDVKVYEPDTIPPSLTAGVVNRTNDTEATIKFTSDETGEYYYQIVNEGDAAPTIDTSGVGTPCDTTEQTITNPTGLTAGAKDIYIVVKDEAGNVSDALKINIEAYREFAGGSGTSEDPYQIETAEQLGNVRNYLGTAFGTKYHFILVDDIDLSGIQWEPIGTLNMKFFGTFDGNGHVITGLTVNTASEYQGLFGYTSAATLENIRLINANIQSGRYSGGLVGAASYYTTIRNCYTTGSIVSTGNRVGGLVGDMFHGSKIYNSYSTATVTGSNEVGGLVGNMSGSGGPVGLSNSYSVGTVSGTYSAVGGAVGHTYSSVLISNVYWNSDVNSTAIGSDESGVAGDATGMTAAQMKETAFADTLNANRGIYSAWAIIEGENDGYPTFAPPDDTAPTLTAGDASRLSDTEATVKFTSDEAGQYYYAVVEDGAGEPAIDTSGTGTDCDTTEQTINLTGLTAGAKDIHIKVKDATGNVSSALKINIPAFAPPDDTAPTLTAGEASRLSDTEATVKFTSDEAGQYYYAVVEDGAGEPAIDTSGTGTDCDTTEQTINLTGLTAGAKDIHIKVKDAAGNVSSALKIDIPAYVAPVSDAEKVAADKAALTWGAIKNTNSTPDNVTTDLNLITTGSVYSSTIDWASSDPGTVTVTGHVYRPSYSIGDKEVTLTATITNGEADDTSTFQLTVIKQPQTDAEAVAQDKAALNIGFASGDSANSVTQNLTFPTTGANGSTISWLSGNTAVISNTGIVTRPTYVEGDADVTVTASVYKNGISDTKSFDLTVLRLPPSDDANLAGLTASGITLSPGFNSNITSYNASVSHGTSSTTITATPADNTATVTINGTAGAGRVVDLSVGTNTITIEVTAQDGTTQKTYTLIISRSSGGSSGGGGSGSSSSPVTANEVVKLIKASNGGDISLAGVTVNVPGDSISADARFRIKELTASEQNNIVPSGIRVKLCGSVYDITTNGSKDFGDNPITVKIAYDPASLAESEQPVIHYYDEETGEWVTLVTTTEFDEKTQIHYAVTTVNHLTRFTVLGTKRDVIPDARIITLTIGNTSATVKGKPYTLDAPPNVDEQAGRTLVPVRFVSEALGAEVEWNADDHIVTITDSGKAIVLTLGSQRVRVDGLEQSIDCAPAVLPPGRTFVPVRFVSETLGAQVEYEAAAGQITITR